MKNHWQPDVWLYRIVVAVFGLTVVGNVAGKPALAMVSQSMPEGMVSFRLSAIRGLARLSTPSPLNR